MFHRTKNIPVAAWAGAVFAIAALPATAGAPFSPTPGVGGGRRLTAQAIPAGAACTGVTNTTKNPDVAYLAGGAGIFVQRFVPPSLPFTPTSVCVATFSSVPTPEPYDVVIFADAGGSPGALLGLSPAGPAQPGTFPGAWVLTPVAGVPPVTGPFWAGVRITTGVAMTMGFETALTGVAQAVSTDGGVTFTLASGAQGAAEIVVGGGAAGTVPTLSGAGLAALLIGIAATGFVVLRRS
ncbi:MAG: hypothetical protein U0529_09020 [Thermoanaerobaculia bacterium]